jgi:hypothetical protein
MIPKLNLLEKLQSQKEIDQRFYNEIDLSNLFNYPIRKESKSSIEDRLKGLNYQAINKVNVDKLEKGEVYHIDSIREIATTYRLRFLPLKYFKPPLPEEAIKKIEDFENKHQTEIQNLQILAPSKLFKLENQDDPLLFAPIGNGYYTLIHQWGGDLSGYRKFLVWPLRGPVELVITLLLVSYLLTMLVPDGLFSKESSSMQFWILFFFFFKGVIGLTIFFGISMGKNFNPFIWNSKYFNA